MAEKRYTDRARKLLSVAEGESKRLNNEYIGTEHALLALTETDGVGLHALKNLGVETEKIRPAVGEIVKQEPEKVLAGKLPYTPRLKKVLELAVKYSTTREHNYVGTEHILYGLFQEEEGVASQILMNLGVERESLDKGIEDLLCPNPNAEQVPKQPQKGAGPKYWSISRELMDLAGALYAQNYRISQDGECTGSGTPVLADVVNEEITIRYDPEKPDQIREVLPLREFLDINMVKYSENQPRERVAQTLRASVKETTDLADRLEKSPEGRQ